MTDLPTLDRLDELTLLIDHGEAVYLRYLPGPESDAAHPSRDHKSGLLTDVEPIAWLSDALLAAADAHYRAQLDAGRDTR